MPHVDTWYKYEQLPWYPHMGPKDAHLWNQYVYKNPSRFLRVAYDTRCGDVENPDPELPKNIIDAWADLCRGRIDVVAEDSDAFYVFEVKPRARGEALGQALNNAHLFKTERNPQKPVYPAVLTDVIIPGTRDVANAMGI